MKIAYAIGWCSQLGLGTDATVFGDHLVAEPLGFELRSELTPLVGFHTTLDTGRMVAAGLQGDARIDYDSHFGFHLDMGPRDQLVIAPGAALAYSWTGSRYQRFLGDIRVGLERRSGTVRLGAYVRPYVGTFRPVGGARSELAAGVLVETVALVDLGRGRSTGPR